MRFKAVTLLSVLAFQSAFGATLDDYSVDQGPVVDSNGSDGLGNLDSLTVPGVPGGQRSISALSSGSMGQSSATIDSGLWAGTISPNGGSSVPAVGIEYSGMGGFDITFSGTENRLAFRATGMTDTMGDEINVTLRVEDSGGDSDLIAAVLGSGVAAYDELLEFQFSTVDPLVDLTSLDSLRLLFFNNNTSAGATVEISLLESTPVDLMLFEIE